MATIDQLLSAVLADVTRARVSADEMSRNLAEIYREDALLRHFPVPRATIRTLSLELVFAVEGGFQSTDDPKPPITRKQIDAALGKVAESSAAMLVDAMLNQEVHRKSDRRRNPVTIGELLGKEAEQKLRAEATDELAHILVRRRDDLSAVDVDAEIVDTLSTLVVRATREAGGVVNNEALSDLKRRGNIPAAEIVKEAVRATADSPALAPTTGVQVLVTREQLKEVPDAALSKMNLTLAIEETDWVTAGDGDDDSGRLIER